MALWYFHSGKIFSHTRYHFCSAVILFMQKFSIEKNFWTLLETYGIGSFAYYGPIDRFISSLVLYFSVRMAHPCVEGGYHAQSIGFRELARSGPGSVVFFVFNQFFVFNRKTGDALRSIISTLLFGGFFNSDFSSPSSNLQKI